MLKAKLQIRKKIKLGMAVCAAAVMMCSVIPVSAASGEYDVIFRAGSKGGFKDSGETSVTWTKPYGEAVGTLPEMEAEAGYYQTGWSPELTEDTVVTKRQVYVAQYARITDAVDYRVNYVDTEGMPIATQKVTTTQKGAEVTEKALAIDGYTPDVPAQTVAVEKKGTDITFTYTAADNTVTETETETQTDVIPGTTTTTGGAAAAGTAGTTGTTGTAGGAGTAGGTAGAAGAAGQGTTTINDENVPLAQNPAGDDSEDTENLEDEEVPKADKDLQKTNPLVYAGIAAAIAVLAGAVILIIRKKKMNR